MTLRDFADYLGLTLETVSLSLSILRGEGILSVTGSMQREIVLLDRSTLAGLASSSGPGAGLQLPASTAALRLFASRATLIYVNAAVRMP